MFIHFILFTPSMVSFFWCIYFTLKRKQNTTPQNIIIFITLFFGILFLNRSYCAYYLDSYSEFPIADIIDSYVTLAIPPLFYLFFKTITTGKLKLQDSFFFIPGLMIAFCINFMYVLMTDQERQLYALQVLKKGSKLTIEATKLLKAQFWLAERFYYLALSALILWVLYYAITQTKRFHKDVQNFYSCDETMHITENNRIYKLLTPLLLLLLIFSSLIYSSFFKEKNIILNCLYIFECIVVYALCYNTGFVNQTISDFQNDLNNSENNKATESSSSIIRKNQIRLNKDEFESLVFKHNVFLQPAIRIDEVARLLGTNRSYLSEMINDVYKMSFSSYINSLRIDHAKKIMLSNPELTQEVIANQSGYLNAPSFSRAFKSHTGMTPKNWLNKETH